MRILVVTKRYTSAQDVLREGVGRPYALFAALRDLGHEVRFLLGDYTERECRDLARGGITFAIRPLGLGRLPSFRRAVGEQLASGFDCVIAEGDPLFAILSLGPCRERGAPLVYDLMDNYETYAVYRIPFIRSLDRRSIRRADAVVCVSGALRAKIAPLRTEGVYVVGNGVDTEQFAPMDRRECRRRLSIPESAAVIGYFGYLVGYKGIEILLEAREALRRRGIQALLLLAGKREASVRLPAEGVFCRGLVSQSEIPACINACDAVAVPSPSNPYTDYCFPLKMLEGLACGVPVVATSLGPVRELVGEKYPWLARPGDPDDLARAIEAALGGAHRNLREIALAHTWREMAARLQSAIEHARRRDKGG